MRREIFDIQIDAVLEVIPYPVVATDLSGVIRQYNSRFLNFSGLQPDEILLTPLTSLFESAEYADEIQSIIRTIGFNVPRQLTLKHLNYSNNLQIAVAEFSGLFDSEKQKNGCLVSFKPFSDYYEHFSNFEIVNKTIAYFGDDFTQNMNLIASLSGQLLGAKFVYYNQLKNNNLHLEGSWNLLEETLDHDILLRELSWLAIKNDKSDFLYIPDLRTSDFASKYPIINKFHLVSYVGHVVKCNGESVGCINLCFDKQYNFDQTEIYLLRLLVLLVEREENRQTLQKSQEYLRETFNFAVEGFLLGSSEGFITDVNHSIEMMTGFTKQELVGKHISEVLFTKESLVRSPLQFEQLRQNKTVISERDILTKSNKLITVEMHSKMMPDKTYQSVLFDISERREAEKKLLISDSSYQGVLNSVDDSIYILDKDGLFLDVNNAAEKMYQYEKQFFLNKSPDFLSAPGMNDMDHVKTLIKAALNGEKSRFEFWAMRRDGTRFLKEVMLTPGNWFGQQVVTALGRDITLRKEAEKALQLSEEKYRLLVQYSSDPIFSYNTDGTYRYVNDSFALVFGKPANEIIGKTPYDFLPASEADKRMELVKQVLETGEKKEVELKLITSSNEEKYFLTLIDPVKDVHENVLWITCMSKDITNRKIAEEELRLKNEQLRAANAEKDKFFSIVAHDLRGPMNGFLGLTGIMLDDLENLSTGELREIATAMRSSAVNIHRLIENLLEWSKMQRGTINFEPQNLLLQSSLYKSLELIKDAADKKSIGVKVNIPEHLVVVADVHMLETIVRNLLSNAIKFTKRGGTIEISADVTQSGMVEIEVSDHGIGMKPTLLENLFILTENTNRKGTEGEPSTGLGLILCKEFVEKNGGKLNVKSVEGVGSTFSFTLPQS